MLKDTYGRFKPDQTAADWYEDTICGACVAGQLLHWVRERGTIGSDDRPLQAVSYGNLWLAVHCDYFKRRIENPDNLTFCGAIRPSETVKGERDGKR